MFPTLEVVMLAYYVERTNVCTEVLPMKRSPKHTRHAEVQTIKAISKAKVDFPKEEVEEGSYYHQHRYHTNTTTTTTTMTTK